MKTTRLNITAVVCALSLSALAAETEQTDPGAIDFGTFDPPKDGEFVEINVSNGLIRMAARLAEQSEPEMAQVLGGLQSIRVNVVGLDSGNRSAIKERIEHVRAQLDRKGWERLVTVKDGKEDVGIFAKLRGEEAIEGIAITVIDGDDKAVMINVVGDVRPEQLAAVAERLNIEPLEQITRELGHRK